MDSPMVFWSSVTKGYHLATGAAVDELCTFAGRGELPGHGKDRSDANAAGNEQVVRGTIFELEVVARSAGLEDCVDPDLGVELPRCHAVRGNVASISSDANDCLFGSGFSSRAAPRRHRRDPDGDSDDRSRNCCGRNKEDQSADAHGRDKK